MSSTTVLLNTDVNGDFSYERPFFGLINAVLLDVGDMDFLTLDVVLRDDARGVDLHTFTGLTGDAYWQPDPPAPVYGTLLVTVTDGGNTKHGRLRLMTET